MNGTTSAIAAYVIITILFWGYAAYLLAQHRSIKPESPGAITLRQSGAALITAVSQAGREEDLHRPPQNHARYSHLPPFGRVLAQETPKANG
jgi:hypothetical protein